MRRVATRTSLLAALLVLGTFAASQASPNGVPPQDRAPVFRSEVALVRLHVSALDRHHLPLLGLGPGAFSILDDGEPRPTAHVFAPDDTPVDVVIVLDLSGSMADELSAARKAASELSTSLRDGDCLLFVPFAERPAEPSWVQGGQPVPKEVSFEIGGRNETVLHDAILTAQQEIEARRADAAASALGLHPATSGSCELSDGAPGAIRREFLVVISDGLDSASRTSWNAIMSNAVALQAPVFAVYAGKAVQRSSPGGAISWEQLSLDRMRMLADATGGVFEELGRRSYGAVFDRVLTLLRSTYVVTFVRSHASLASHEPWHDVQVGLVGRAGSVRSPTGYYTRSPEESRARVQEDVGRRLVSAGNIDAAVGQLEAAVRLNPDSWKLPLELARAYWLQARTSDALESALRATRLRPGNGHGIASRLAANLGRYDVAIEQAVRAHQAGEDVDALLGELLAANPGASTPDLERRLLAPRVFLAPTAVTTPRGFFEVRRLDAELARQLSDSPMLGLVNDRSLADYLLWFDLHSADRSGTLRGEVRLNRPEHLNRVGTRNALSRRPDTPLTRLRQWTIKSWYLEIPAPGDDADMRATASPIVGALAKWMQDRNG